MAYDTNDFATDVLERSHDVPVLVDFWAEWCGPCKILGPILERVAQQSDGDWVLAKLDTEKHPRVAAEYGIRSIPNVKLFVDGQVADEFIGALPEPAVVEWIRKALPSKYRSQLEGARQLLSENGASQAREMLQPIVAAEPENHDAVVLLAQTFLDSDPDQALKTVEPVKMGSKHFEGAEAIRDLVGMFAHLADEASLPQDPVREAYLIAIRAARASDFESALDGFIEVIRKNRYYDDDGARKACVAIFKLLGEEHPVTREYRPALSNALF